MMDHLGPGAVPIETLLEDALVSPLGDASLLRGEILLVAYAAGAGRWSAFGYGNPSPMIQSELSLC